jgi:uncharacterized membrane protein
MGKGRLEAFSDAVLAIAITIMVLELKVPHRTDLASLQPLLPKFFSYLLSFIYLAIYWNNHHHMLHSVNHVNGKVLWANIHLLFWLSLIPFVTAWMGENQLATLPVAFYGIVLFLSALAYYMLSHSLAVLHGKDSAIAMALGRDWKGKLSLALYLTGIALSFIHPYIGIALYVTVAAIWFLPDRRFERSE